MSTARLFRSPRDIVWGRGSIAHLEHLPGKRALIIADRALSALGTTARVGDHLRRGGQEVHVFDDVEPEPSIQTIRHILARYHDFRPDVIVGMGGGSAIDASKAFRVFYEHPHLRFEDIHALSGPPRAAIPPFEKTRHVAISSTSGTGSDVSHVCILADPAIPAKCPIVSQELKPDMAIVDPDIADSMPRAVLADTGLDALTHAIESYVSLPANDFSRGFSLEAIRLLIAHLPAAYLENDRAAKEHVHYAATMAGVAFSNSANGICHTVATKVGGVFKLTHGRGNAIALPYAVQFNRKAAERLFAGISRALGHPGDDPARATDGLIETLQRIRRQLEIPESYRQAGIDERAYAERLQDFALTSGAYPTTLTNPRKPTVRELALLYRACYEGEYGLIR